MHIKLSVNPRGRWGCVWGAGLHLWKQTASSSVLVQQLHQTAAADWMEVNCLYGLPIETDVHARSASVWNMWPPSGPDPLMLFVFMRINCYLINKFSRHEKMVRIHSCSSFLWRKHNILSFLLSTQLFSTNIFCKEIGVIESNATQCCAYCVPSFLSRFM